MLIDHSVGVSGRGGYRNGDWMKTYVALLRGINVGGNNVLSMKNLVALLENIGSKNVKTYIQSGNAVFEHEEEDASLLSSRIRTTIQKSNGFEPQLLLLELEDIERAVDRTRFPKRNPNLRLCIYTFYLLGRTILI